MLAVIIVIVVALAMLLGAFARLLALRREWRDQPPPKYGKPYKRWDDDDRGGH